MSVSRTIRSPRHMLQFVAAICFAFVMAAAAPASRAQSQPASTAAASATPAAAKPTSTAKKKSTKKHHSSRREPSQKAPTPDRISEIQSALSRNGFYEGNPNGKWDSSSVAAMQKFQSANGLDATGKLDALSLQKLGLGSEIAGVSAPETPHPTPSTSPKPATAAPATTPPSAQPQPQKPSSPSTSSPQK
jgi:peptidoglycan hydrolase-like protein with peptidoglycan-binding domain